MSRQTFDTLDVLRLEVAEQPAGLVNLIANPTGELGGWGWVTPVPNTTVTGSPGVNPGTGSLVLKTTVAQQTYATSEFLPMAAGKYVAARLQLKGPPTTNPTRGLFGSFEFYDANRQLISSTARSGEWPGWSSTIRTMPTALAPAGTAFVKFRLDLSRSGSTTAVAANDYVTFGDVTVAVADSAATLGISRRNLVTNPSIETSTAGYSVSPDSSLHVQAGAGYAGGAALRATMNARDAIQYVTLTGVEPVVGGRRYAFQARIKGYRNTARVTWRNSSGLAVGTNTLGATTIGDLASYVLWTGIADAPAGAVAVEVTFDTSQSFDLQSGDFQDFDAFAVEQVASDATTVPAYFDGATPAAGGITYAWTGTPHASASTATSSSGLDYIAPIAWLSILGSSHQLTIDRDELDVATLTANINDGALDPSQSSVLRPGRPLRVTALSPAGKWEPLFTGAVRSASVVYNLRAREGRQAQIELVATDAATDLANVGRSEGVATIGQLPYVLEGAGVPWNVNGSGNQVGTAVVVSRNDNASALDQVGLTRDSTLGYAWVDRRNIVNAWDADQLGATIAGTLSEARYTDVAIDYDTDRVINEVTVKFLRLNPDTGESEEVTYGPYADAESRKTWGPHAATFTIQWEDENEAQIEAFAGAILAANATPVIRINSVTFPVRSTADLSVNAGERLALLDLFDLVTVVNASAGLNEPLRVRGLRHTITPKRWTVEATFAGDGTVSSPTVAPSPSAGGGGKTIGQLLRPVGEVTMWYGLAANVPSGWLVCNGGSFSSTEYPDLAALLGGTLLPDLNDRVPVGASLAKPLGSIGGAELRPLPSHQHTHTTPNHEHFSGSLSNSTYSHNRATNTTTGGSGVRIWDGNGNHSHTISGQTGKVVDNPDVTSSTPINADTIDVRQPYRAIHFIIRGR